MMPATAQLIVCLLARSDCCSVEAFLESAAESREPPYLDKKNVEEVLNLQSDGAARQTVSSQTSARRYHLGEGKMKITRVRSLFTGVRKINPILPKSRSWLIAPLTEILTEKPLQCGGHGSTVD